MSGSEFSAQIQDRLSVNSSTANSIAGAARNGRQTLMKELAGRYPDEDHNELADELEELRDEYEFDQRVASIDNGNNGNFITRHPWITAAGVLGALWVTPSITAYLWSAQEGAGADTVMNRIARFFRTGQVFGTNAPAAPVDPSPPGAFS